MSVLLIDLDETLYPANSGILGRVHERMNHYLYGLGVPASEVAGLRERYWREHGTTLNGLIATREIDVDAYLDFVHDVDLSELTLDPGLGAVLEALPHRKTVFTNAPRPHAERVLDRLGVAHAFESIFSIEEREFVPKPRDEAFHAVLRALGVAGPDCWIVDDDPRNLAVGRRLGMGTILVRGRHAPDPADLHVVDRVAEIARILG